MKTVNTFITIAIAMLISAPVMAANNNSGDVTVDGNGANAASDSYSTSQQGNSQGITTTNHGSDLSDAVPGVIAPSLTTTLSETCMGSTSLGAAGAGFGISFGSTWKDEACVRRLDSRELRSFGSGLAPNDAILFHFAAKERMCADKKIRAAFERVYAMTDRRDALCQVTADDVAKAEMQRAADQAAGLATPIGPQYVEDQRTEEQVAEAKHPYQRGCRG